MPGDYNATRSSPPGRMSLPGPGQCWIRSWSNSVSVHEARVPPCILHRMRGIAWLPAVAALACGSVTKGDSDAGGDPGDFAVSLAPASALLRQAESIDLEVTIDRRGVAGDIEVTAGGLPDGVSGAPLTIADGEVAGTLTLEAAADAAQGEAAVTVTGETAAGAAGDGDLRLLVGGAPGSYDLSFADS